MFTKEDKVKIKSILEKHFCKEDKIAFFCTKELKEKDYQYVIPYKTRTKIELKNLSKVEKQLRNEFGNDNIAFIRFTDFVNKIIPESKVLKTPFWDSRNIDIKNPWRICPIGEHWVRRHPKHLDSGTVTDHDGHCRRNRSGKDVLKGDEIDLIAEHELFKKPKIKVSSNDLEFKRDGNKYDNLISGWVAYWNDIFKLNNPLPPNFVKALIATESSFISFSKAENTDKNIGPARGLIQITEETFRALKNHNGELKDYIVELSEDELWEPNKNVCAAVRWLFRKREAAKATLKREPTWEEVLWAYKGILKSKTSYATKVKNDIAKFLLMMEIN